jgi:hypothetical protein
LIELCAHESAAGKKLRKIGLSSSPPPELSKDTLSISGGDQILFSDFTLGSSYPMVKARVSIDKKNIPSS